MKNNTTRFIPFLLAVCLVGGIAIGTFYANTFGKQARHHQHIVQQAECLAAHH